MASVALLESPKLISRKIWMIEKSWNFHTVRLHNSIFRESTIRNNCKFVAFKELTLLTWKSSLSKGSHITIFNQSVRSTKFCHATWRLKAVKWLKRLPSSRLSKRSQRNLRKYRVVKFRFFFSLNGRKYFRHFREYGFITNSHDLYPYIPNLFSFLEGLAFKLSARSTSAF